MKIARGKYQVICFCQSQLIEFKKNSTGSVSSSLPSSAPHSLRDHDIYTFVQPVTQRPCSHLYEIQNEIANSTGTIASLATICRELKRLGFIRKKLTTKK